MPQSFVQLQELNRTQLVKVKLEGAQNVNWMHTSWNSDLQKSCVCVRFASPVGDCGWTDSEQKILFLYEK